VDAVTATRLPQKHDDTTAPYGCSNLHLTPSISSKSYAPWIRRRAFAQRRAIQPGSLSGKALAQWHSLFVSVKALSDGVSFEKRCEEPAASALPLTN